MTRFTLSRRTASAAGIAGLAGHFGPTRLARAAGLAAPAGRRRAGGLGALRFLSRILLLLALLPPAPAAAGWFPSADETRNPLGAGRHDDAPEPGPIRRTPGAPEWPDDFEMGLQAARAYAHHFGLVEDDSVLARLHRIAYEVTSQAGRPDLLFTFHILDVPDANAFALPGGFLFLTKGMIDLHLPDAALANLIGHEAAHVTGNHFSRAGRVNTALSLLHTAVMVAAILGASSSSSSNPSGGYDRDRETGEIRTSLAGREAAIQGTSLFGSVFKELLVRGYSRGLEFEADDNGRRFAARAGYPSTGSVRLMEELHEHIYEDQEFGYWRTHPYFSDRVLRARSAAAPGAEPPDSAEVVRYRNAVAERLSAVAATILDEPTALFLYRAALRAAPAGESALTVEHQLLQIRAQRMRKLKPILRPYGRLIADYDSLLARPAADLAARFERARAERDSLDGERRELYDEYRQILERPDAGTPFLELFLENFPDDPQAPELRLRLAERYRLADRPDEAALALAALDHPGWREQRSEALRRVLPLARELTTSQRVLLEARSDSVRVWAAERLEAQAGALDSLEIGSRFVQEYPDSPVVALVADKMESLAMKRYYAARLREGMQDPQGALDGYHQVILLAPGTKAAGRARDGIDRIQRTAGS